MARGPSLRERVDRETLRKLYEVSGLSTADIAERFGAKSSQILRLMNEYKIPAIAGQFGAQARIDDVACRSDARDNCPFLPPAGSHPSLTHTPVKANAPPAGSFRICLWKGWCRLGDSNT